MKHVQRLLKIARRIAEEKRLRGLVHAAIARGKTKPPSATIVNEEQQPGTVQATPSTIIFKELVVNVYPNIVISEVNAHVDVKPTPIEFKPEIVVPVHPVFNVPESPPPMIRVEAPRSRDRKVEFTHDADGVPVSAVIKDK